MSKQGIEVNRFGDLWLTRRRVLQAGALGGAGLAAAALIGCGDDDEDEAPAPSGGGAPAGTQAPAAAQPKKGGTLRLAAPASPAALDPFRTQDANNRGPAGAIYSALFRQQGATFEKAPIGDMVADLAKSWEFTPDGLRLTIKLQPTAKFHPPISRKLTAEDVVFSYNRFAGKAGLGEPAPNAAQLVFVDTMEAVDPETVLVRMKTPNARALWRLSDDFNLLIMPKETGSSFNPSERMVGAGPWMWDGFEPGVNLRLKRNPEWWGGPDRPYMDGFTLSVVPQPATQIAQFKAKNLDSINTVSPDEILNLKRDRSDTMVEPRKTFGWGYLAFGEPRTTAPWKDERVRYALSLALDRAAMIKAVYNIDALDAQFGVSKLVGWHGQMPAGYAGQSIDPRQDAANTGKYIKFDLTQAKQLLDAAGFKDGFSAPYHYTTIYGAAWKLEAELYPQLLNQIGVKLQTQVDDFASVYTPKTFRGEFDGIGFLLQAFPDIGEYLTEMYRPGAGRNHSKVNDAAILKKVDDIEATLDVNKRNELIRTLQTDLAKPMWYVPGVAWQLTWQAWDPGYKGRENSHGNGRGGEYRYGFPFYWLDK